VQPSDDRLAQIQSILRQGETVTWSGSPDPAIRFSPFDLLFIPFSLFWSGFVLLWNGVAWSSGAPGMFSIFGLPFLVVAFQITFGRFNTAARRKRKTTYAVTSQRAIIIDYRGQVRFVELSQVIHDATTRKRYQSVTVLFRDPSSPTQNRFLGSFDPQLSGVLNLRGMNWGVNNFLFVDVTDGEALLRALQDAPSAA
jgi:hypothetical protein